MIYLNTIFYKYDLDTEINIYTSYKYYFNETK